MKKINPKKIKINIGRDMSLEDVKKVKISNTFSEVIYDVLLSAINIASEKAGKDIYTFLETTPKTTLVVNICNEIKNLGYNVVKLPITPKGK